MFRKVILLLSLLFALPCAAQFNAGLRLGTTAFYAREAQEQPPAYTLGPQVQLGVLDNLGFSLAFLYQTPTLAHINKESLRRSSYTLPFNVMWNVSGGSYNYFFFECGPEFSTHDFSSSDADVAFNFGIGIRMFTFLQATFDWHLPTGSTRHVNWQQFSQADYYRRTVMNISLAVML